VRAAATGAALGFAFAFGFGFGFTACRTATRVVRVGVLGRAYVADEAGVGVTSARGAAVVRVTALGAGFGGGVGVGVDTC
jgi:hypothetical protein